MTMILLQPKNPKGLKLHEAMEEKGLVLAVLSAGMTFSTLKISVGVLMFGKTIGLVNDKEKVRKVLNFEARSSPIFSRAMFEKNEISWVFWFGRNRKFIFLKFTSGFWKTWQMYSWEMKLSEQKLPLSELFFEHHDVYKKEQGHNDFSFLKFSLVCFLLFDFFN